MSKFHIDSDGNAGECRATRGGCPFSPEEQHHDSLEAAREAYEKLQTVTQISLKRTANEWASAEVLPELNHHVDEIRGTFSAEAGAGSEQDLHEYLDDYLLENWHHLEADQREVVRNSLLRELGTPTNLGTEEEPAWTWESNGDFYQRCAS